MAGGEIFVVKYKGVDFYQLYVFDKGPPLRPKPGMRDIIKALDLPPEEIGIWFMSGCGMLGSKRPQDVLENDPAAVVAAAKDLAEGITHG